MVDVGHQTALRGRTMIYCAGQFVEANVTRERGFALCSRCAKRVRIVR